MPEWKLAADQKSWELCDGFRVLATLRWDPRAGEFGSYVDGSGKPISRRFDVARDAVEKAVTP
jgi:hypothetical protein